MKNQTELELHNDWSPIIRYPEYEVRIPNSKIFSVRHSLPLILEIQPSVKLLCKYTTHGRLFLPITVYRSTIQERCCTLLITVCLSLDRYFISLCCVRSNLLCFNWACAALREQSGLWYSLKQTTLRLLIFPIHVVDILSLLL